MQVNSPTKKHVISSPRVLSRFSPVASMIKRTNSCKRFSIDKSEDSKETRSKLQQDLARKSTFTTFASTTNVDSTPKKYDEEDFTAALGDESPKDSGSHAQKLPTLKVNSNDLSWLKEQKGSKDMTVLQEEMTGDVVRISSHTKKVSQFYIPPIPAEDSVPSEEDTEELKAPPVPMLNRRISTAGMFVLYCECGNVCEGDNSLCNKCLDKQKPIEFSGHLYTQVHSGLKLCWIHLLNKELYCIREYSLTHI